MEKLIVNNYGSFDTVFVKGKGSTLWDENGKEFIDFLSSCPPCCSFGSVPIISKFPNDVKENGF